MKEAAAAAISLMTGLAMLTGCSRAEVEETIQPLVADAIEESDSEAEAVKEEDESPLIPEIDTDIKNPCRFKDRSGKQMCQGRILEDG